MRVFFFYTCSVAFFISLLFFLRTFDKDTNHSLVVQKIYPIVESIILSFYFFHILRSKYRKSVLAISTFLLSSLFAFELFSETTKPSFLPMALQGMFFIVVILYYFFEAMQKITAVPIYFSSSFWILIAFLINFSGTFFLFLFSISVPNKNVQFINQYNIIYTIFTAIKDILLCYSILLNRSAGTAINDKNKYVQPNLDIEQFTV